MSSCPGSEYRGSPASFVFPNFYVAITMSRYPWRWTSYNSHRLASVWTREIWVTCPRFDSNLPSTMICQVTLILKNGKWTNGRVPVQGPFFSIWVWLCVINRPLERCSKRLATCSIDTISVPWKLQRPTTSTRFFVCLKAEVLPGYFFVSKLVFLLEDVFILDKKFLF